MSAVGRYGSKISISFFVSQKNLLKSPRAHSNSLEKRIVIDDIDTEIIAMHYGIVWGERQRVFSQD